MKIKLFTLKYPYGNGEQFLHEEIKLGSKIPNLQIEIVPFELENNNRNLPPNVEINDSLAKMIQRNSEQLIYPVFLNFFTVCQAILKHKIRTISGLRDVIGFAHHGAIVQKWAIKNVQIHDILYTYWFERVTFGLSMFKRVEKHNNCLISRAHGYDLYENRRKHGFIPFRNESLTQLDHIYTVSESGRKHLIDRFDIAKKTTISYLGVHDSKKNPSKEGNNVTIVSCSSIIDLKRVDLIVKVIKEFAHRNQQLNVIWNHFGDGNRKSLENELNDISANLSFTIHGDVLNEDLMSFYSQNFVDLFINLSTTEGLPMSMMEAASFGIPILATDVGGVSEIVSSENGVLLDREFTIDEAINMMSTILSNNVLRSGSRRIFEEKFVAEKNYELFYSSLKMLANEQ